MIYLLVPHPPLPPLFHRLVAHLPFLVSLVSRVPSFLVGNRWVGLSGALGAQLTPWPISIPVALLSTLTPLEPPMAGTDSPTFHDKNADIIFLSSDKLNPVRFYIHSKNLEVSTGAFPPVSIRGTQVTGDLVGLTVDEPVQLPEPATVLEVLFAFMYPRQHPELEDTPFEELEPLAEAVEKYQVYPALTTCKARMKGFLRDHPVRVGAWAARHGHTTILNEAAPWMTCLPLVDALGIFSGHLMLPWIEYYTSWEKVKNALLYFRDPEDNEHQNIRSSILPNNACMISWVAIAFPIIERFREGFEAGRNPFLDLDALFLSQGGKRECCMSGVARWRKCVEEAIDSLPKLSQILARHAEK
ncbi:hypothetical protein BKA70DRAFT_232705 [Coprinopsis sp. MPI-PUGE-AT-0042]|nr:hypothetical protein BKA70DRAFT_232705 [Coprinopsis sp. MPI-PUGE-AT-0042]